MVDTILHTARLVMRRARRDDLDAIHAVLSDSVSMRYWSTLPHDRLEQSERWLAGMMAGDPDQDDFILEQNGRVIGKLGCFRLPEIGFILRSGSMGQGLASEAMTAFLARRRAIGDPRRLTADVDPRNAASLALLRRHGFTETHRAQRTWLIGEQWCDSVYLAIDLPSSLIPWSSLGR